MKKELAIHLLFTLSLIILTSLIKGWMGLIYWTFWLGGLLGTFLPDLDHFIYFYILKPHELTSQRVLSLIKNKEFVRSVNLLAETRYERKELIFHTTMFQLIFLVLTFFVVSSSVSFFAKGLVLAFFLHLLVDQLVDLVETGGLSNWFSNLGNIDTSWIDKQKATVYLLFLLLLQIVFIFIA